MERTIKSSADTLLGVMREKLSLERDRDANLKVLSADAPDKSSFRSDPGARSRSASLTEALTSHRSNAKTVAQSIAQFEKQELEARFSKRLWRSLRPPTNARVRNPSGSMSILRFRRTEETGNRRISAPRAIGRFRRDMRILGCGAS